LEGVAVFPSAQDPGGPHDHTQLVEQTIADGFPLLVFPKLLEDRFLNEGADKRFLMIVAAGLASVLLFGFLLVPDFLMTPDVFEMGLALRLGLYLPVTLGGLYVLRMLSMPVLTEWTVAAAGILAGFLTVLIYSHSTSEWAFTRTVELNIIVVYICAFARFWPALVLSISMALAHAFMVTTLHDFTGVLVPNTSLLIATTIGFTLYGNYKLEHDERLAFLLELREKALDAELQTAHDRLARMATTDVLTELANRRYFEDFLAECAQRAQAMNRPLSLVLIDIDYFKPYNDHYGHQAGDKCLVAVAQALSSCMRRPSDLVARWGGEEFAVVMSDADMDAAAAAAERIRRAVHALGLPHAASACAPVVSVSVGVACAPPGPAINLTALVSRADVALYQAKSNGRNQVSQGATPC
jgi:diguanylate cyclase (GGDEF)-like protein